MTLNPKDRRQSKPQFRRAVVVPQYRLQSLPQRPSISAALSLHALRPASKRASIAKPFMKSSAFIREHWRRIATRVEVSAIAFQI
jgi:hypothetical protein